MKREKEVTIEVKSRLSMSIPSVDGSEQGFGRDEWDAWSG